MYIAFVDWWGVGKIHSEEGKEWNVLKEPITNGLLLKLIIEIINEQPEGSWSGIKAHSQFVEVSQIRT